MRRRLSNEVKPDVLCRRLLAADAGVSFTLKLHRLEKELCDELGVEQRPSQMTPSGFEAHMHEQVDTATAAWRPRCIMLLLGSRSMTQGADCPAAETGRGLGSSIGDSRCSRRPDRCDSNFSTGVVCFPARCCWSSAGAALLEGGTVGCGDGDGDGDGDGVGTIALSAGADCAAVGPAHLLRCPTRLRTRRLRSRLLLRLLSRLSLLSLRAGWRRGRLLPVSLDASRARGAGNVERMMVTATRKLESARCMVMCATECWWVNRFRFGGKMRE